MVLSGVSRHIPSQGERVRVVTCTVRTLQRALMRTPKDYVQFFKTLCPAEQEGTS